VYVMQTDGTHVQALADSLDLQGSPAWAPDGMSIVSAANDHGVPHLFRISLQGRSPSLFVHEYALEPAWAPSGRFLVYTGPDIGTNYPLEAVIADGSSYPLPALMLSRGARHLTFVAGGRELAFLRGELQHKNLWVVDLRRTAERWFWNGCRSGRTWCYWIS
jgi:Tol biopolymer transport system component